MRSPQKLTIIVSAVAAVALSGSSLLPVAAQETSAPAPARRSSLPDEALKLAQQAEQHLAANEPEKAIAVFKSLDKQHPNQPAISLRLAQINDTLNRAGYALFYYRRYIKQAGPRSRDIAVERVSSLELMAGADAEAEKAAREMGETTVALATPAPKIERQLVTEAKDGSRVPINSEKDLERLQRQGVPQTAPSTPVPTSAPAIVLPPQLTATVAHETAQPQETPRRQTPPRQTPSPAYTTTPAPPRPKTAAAPATQASVYASATPRPPDEDALLANAFSKGSVSESAEIQVDRSDESVRSDRSVRSENPPPPARATPEQKVVFTKQTPAHESPRAAAFFNVAKAAGAYASVAIVNDLKDAVVTLSLTPEDNGEVISAILVPGEKRTLRIKPARYDLSANASTNDYSPITLMNAQFKYTFEPGRQYTRRFNKTSLEQVD